MKKPVLIAVVVVALLIVLGRSRRHKDDLPEDPMLRAKVAALQAQRVSAAAACQSGGFGSVLLADFEIRNGLEHYSASDIKVACDVVAKTGTRLKTVEHTIYERIPPGRSVRMNRVNLGFVDPQVSACEPCMVLDFEIQEWREQPTPDPRVPTPRRTWQLKVGTH